MLVHDSSEEPVDPGRTTTQLDDFLARRLAGLSWSWVAAIAALVYAAWGLLLPLLLNAGLVSWIGFTTGGALLAGVVILARLLPVVEGRIRSRQLQQTSDLRRLSASEFEEVVGELFRIEGWHVDETGRHGAGDGNVDLRLERDGQRRLVQCKRWTSWLVGVKEVRELAGTLMREGLPGSAGVLVTSAGFTTEAVTEANQLGVELINGDRLVERLILAGAAGLLQPPRDAWVCPNCASPMRLAKSEYGWWMRCPDWGTNCDGKQDLGRDDREVVERLIAGA